MTTEQVIIPDRLREAAREIEDYVRSADDGLLKAARRLVEVKKQFENKEFTVLTWKEWCTRTLKLSDRRVRELLRIGKAEAPKSELADQRAKNAARQQRHRDTKAERTKAGARVQQAAQEAKSASSALQSATPARAQEPKAVELSPEAKRLIDWARNASADQVSEVLTFIASLDNASTPGPTR